jgi:hypothetical protein
MKPTHFFLPTLLIVAVAALWFSRQASEAASLRKELESLREANARPAAEAGNANLPTGSADDGARLGQQIAELREALAREESETRAAEKSLAEIQRKIPPVGEGEMVVSLGRITDMGKEAAQAIRGVSTLFERTGESETDKEQVQASFMKLVAWMPEIAGFEERPAEMACFQAAVFRELFKLDEPRARQLEATIETHFDAVQAAGLTAASSAQPNWRERRTAMLTPLLWQLRPFMPQDFKSPGIVTQIVNIGAGLETKTETHLSDEPGKSRHSVSMSLPSWPRLPWLPEKTNAPR